MDVQAFGGFGTLAPPSPRPSPANSRKSCRKFIIDEPESGTKLAAMDIEQETAQPSFDPAENRRAWIAGAMVATLALVLLGLTIALDENAAEPFAGKRDLKSPVGWVGLCCAVVLFGSVGVMVKIPSVMNANVDPMIFQIYQSSGIVFVSLVVLVYEVCQEHGKMRTIEFSWWGVMGAAIIYIAQAFAYNGVRGLGNAVGPATWAGIGMCVSFTWGVGLYHESVGSVGECVGALAVLVSGIFGVALSPTQLPQKIFGLCSSGESSVVDTPMAAKADRDSTAVPPEAGAAQEEAPTISRETGLVCALTVGLVDGSLMVPYKAFLGTASNSTFVQPWANATTDPTRMLRQSASAGSRGTSMENSYIISLGIGLLIVAPVFSLLYIVCANGRKMPPLLLTQGGPAGFATGLFWAVANMGSVHATKYLGMSLGFPLTQTCICINGIWGILFYREIQGMPNISMYSFCTVAIIGGAVLLTQACAT